MTYAEALTRRAALESAMLSSSGVVSIQVGDETITYASQSEADRALARLNRDIAAYERRAVNLSPNVSRARWR